MKRFLLLITVWLFAFSIFSSIYAKDVHVNGYYKKNGTYVQPHERSSPDGDFNNNWSTKGNVNPYTGKEGTRVTPPDESDSYYPTKQRNTYDNSPNEFVSPNKSGTYDLNKPTKSKSIFDNSDEEETNFNNSYGVIKTNQDDKKKNNGYLFDEGEKDKDKKKNYWE